MSNSAVKEITEQREFQKFKNKIEKSSPTTKVTDLGRVNPPDIDDVMPPTIYGNPRVDHMGVVRPRVPESNGRQSTTNWDNLTANLDATFRTRNQLSPMVRAATGIFGAVALGTLAGVLGADVSETVKRPLTTVDIVGKTIEAGFGGVAIFAGIKAGAEGLKNIRLSFSR